MKLMKKYFIVVFLMLIVLVGVRPFLVSADITNPLGNVLISEVFPGSQTSASQEFIELYNTTQNEISLEGWSLQYASSTGLSWRSLPNVVIYNIDLPPEGYYLLATTDYLPDKSSISFGATLSQTGGQLRLVNADGLVEDEVSWGSSSTMALGSPASAPSAGQSIIRKTVNGLVSNLQNNSLDFEVTQQPSPQGPNSPVAEPDSPPITVLQPPETEVTNPPSPPTIEVIDTPQDSQPPLVVTDSALLPLKISELLPNPESPQSDEEDEFVELYNPNSSPVELNGYTIVAGNNDTYRYTLTSGSVSGGGYGVFYSGDTTLTLSNSGGRIKLLAPGGSQVDITSSYISAPSGQSWILADSGWSWTTTLTPLAANILTVPSESNPTVLSSTSPPEGSSTPTGPFAKVEISELLPNPKSPQTDANDEFIELYNPNKQSLNLAGYKLVAGTNGTYKYTFKEKSIPAGGYLTLYSRDTKLTLSNSGGVVRLQAPDESGIDETGTYGKASDGQSWIYANGKWQWTVTPTPGKANIYKAVAVSAVGSVSAISNRTSGVNGSGSNAGSARASEGKEISHPLIIGVVGAMAVVYAVYEYRHDMANQLNRFRRHREARRGAGQAS